MKKNLLIIAAFSLISLVSCGTNSPYIGSNGNWYVDGIDQGIPATGDKGDKGDKGENGLDGKDGDSITVISVSKVSTSGNVDTYELEFSDGTKSNFTVTNGKDGTNITVTSVRIKESNNNVDTYEICFSNGFSTSFSVTNGKNLTILKIEKVSSSENYDTYRISYSDDSYVDFVVTNGATPYIGENGNWWIKDIDTNVIADYSKKETRNYTQKSLIASSGLVYETRTINGTSGYVVSGYDEEMVRDVALEYYLNDNKKYDSTNFNTYVNSILGNKEIIIPNYIGSIPVIGVLNNVLDSYDITSISLSSNTIYLESYCFSDTSKLESFDFNNCNLTYIPENCFNSSSIKNITLPKTITRLYEKAFYDCELIDLNYSNITWFGNQSLNKAVMNDYIWISNKVEYVGDKVFSTNFVYKEYGLDETNISTDLFYKSYADEYLIINNCIKTDTFIYALNDDNTVTAYKYFTDEKYVNVPSSIDGHTLTKIGAGFLSNLTDLFCGNIKEDSEIYKLNKYYEVILPDTIKSIDYYSLALYGGLLYIPSSVKNINSLNGTFFDTFFAFEDASSITFNEKFTLEEFIEGNTSSYLKWPLKYKDNININLVEFDEENKTFYYNNVTSYSVLAFIDNEVSVATVKDTYNNLPITLISSYAYANHFNLKSLIIGDNINKIQKYGIIDDLDNIYIPSNVSIVNKYGINAKNVLFESKAITDDFDSSWNVVSSPKIYYEVTDYEFNGIYNGFNYTRINNEITLTKNNNNDTKVVLPSSINGYPVTRIEQGFDSNSAGKKYYIPSSIVNCASKAFIDSTSKTYFYFESSSIPSKFETYWCNSSSYYKTNVTLEKFNELK